MNHFVDLNNSTLNMTQNYKLSIKSLLWYTFEMEYQSLLLISFLTCLSSITRISEFAKIILKSDFKEQGFDFISEMASLMYCSTSILGILFFCWSAMILKSNKMEQESSSFSVKEITDLKQQKERGVTKEYDNFIFSCVGQDGLDIFKISGTEMHFIEQIQGYRNKYFTQYSSKTQHQAQQFMKWIQLKQELQLKYYIKRLKKTENVLLQIIIKIPFLLYLNNIINMYVQNTCLQRKILFNQMNSQHIVKLRRLMQPRIMQYCRVDINIKLCL